MAKAVQIVSTFLSSSRFLEAFLANMFRLTGRFLNKSLTTTIVPTFIGILDSSMTFPDLSKLNLCPVRSSLVLDWISRPDNPDIAFKASPRNPNVESFSKSWNSDILEV